MRFRQRCWLYCTAATFALLTASCTPVAFLNNTTTLGGTTPGSRGNINVAFVNNTPFRAIFTYGTYDPQNDTFIAQFQQFTANPDPTTRLEGNSESAVATFQCGRAVSVGGDRLLQLINYQHTGAGANAAALQPGVGFSDQPLDSPEADQATAGRAPGVITLQGAEYQCDSLIVYTFEVDPTQPSGFRIDQSVFLP